MHILEYKFLQLHQLLPPIVPFLEYPFGPFPTPLPPFPV